MLLPASNKTQNEIEYLTIDRPPLPITGQNCYSDIIFFCSINKFINIRKKLQKS